MLFAVAQFANKISEVDLGAVLGSLYVSFAGERLHTKENVCGSAALVLVVHACRRTGNGWYGDSGVLKQLLARLVDANLRVRGIIRPPVDFEHVFHRRNERGVLFRRDTESLSAPGLQLVFFPIAV